MAGDLTFQEREFCEVLRPWALIAALMGNVVLAIGMLALYIVITAIRNTIEPRLVGRKIGLHPLATLISMFVGLQLFGIIGMFLFPLMLSLLVQFKRGREIENF